MNYIILANPVADWLIALAAMAAVTIGLDALKSIIARRLGAGATQTETGTPALLHDIGQVSLTEPIPGGATVLAAPRHACAAQRRP